jgi:hypothetical protein
MVSGEEISCPVTRQSWPWTVLFDVVSGLPIIRELSRDDPPDITDHCGSILQTHRQILCHVFVAFETNVREYAVLAACPPLPHSLVSSRRSAGESLLSRDACPDWPL